MSHQNLEFFNQLQLQSANASLNSNGTGNRSAYRQPEVFSLGSLEKVQAYYKQPHYDGPNSWYTYSG